MAARQLFIGVWSFFIANECFRTGFLAQMLVFHHFSSRSRRKSTYWLWSPLPLTLTRRCKTGSSPSPSFGPTNPHVSVSIRTSAWGAFVLLTKSQYYRQYLTCIIILNAWKDEFRGEGGEQINKLTENNDEDKTSDTKWMKETWSANSAKKRCSAPWMTCTRSGGTCADSNSVTSRGIILPVKDHEKEAVIELEARCYHYRPTAEVQVSGESNKRWMINELTGWAPRCARHCSKPAIEQRTAE